MTSDESAGTLDQILEKYVGGVGKYQIFITMILYYLNFSGQFYHVYTAYSPNHRCRIPICENDQDFMAWFGKENESALF